MSALAMFVRVVLTAVILLAALPSRAADAAVRLPAMAQGDSPLFTIGSPVGDVVYTPGRGLQIGDTGLALGGYSNLTLTRDEGRSADLELDDVSLFVVVDPDPRLHLFAEIEYADIASLDEHGRVTSHDEALTAERLFADVRMSDAVNLRAGIFLTPVGRWNTIHAAPLVWTTSRPLTTQAFDPNLTGVMLFGTLFPSVGTLSYSLYDQFAEPLEDDPAFEPADHSAGGRLELAVDPTLSIGASYLAARRDGDWRQLGGVDLLWTSHLVEVMSEMVVAGEANGHPEWGGYLQVVLALTQRLSLVDRYEHFAAAKPTPAADLVSLGLAFSPLPAVIMKVEYLIAARSTSNADPGVKASIATLF